MLETSSVWASWLPVGPPHKSAMKIVLQYFSNLIGRTWIKLWFQDISDAQKAIQRFRYKDVSMCCYKHGLTAQHCSSSLCLHTFECHSGYFLFFYWIEKNCCPESTVKCNRLVVLDEQRLNKDKDSDKELEQLGASTVTCPNHLSCILVYSNRVLHEDQITVSVPRFAASMSV